jgi:3-oxoacyl-[acyl-carrier protein] reductase
MAEHIYESFGRVDVLVNNAGIATSSNVAEMPLAMWEEMISVNLTSVFLCSRAFLSGMLAQGLGRIINVGSQLVLRGAAGIAHYCAAKGAVHAFTKALAREVAGQGITVNAIVPGPTETGMIAGVPEDALEGIRQEVPLGRFAKPEEVAPTAVLLAFDEGGAYYTGSFLNVSGGHMM